MNTVKTAYTKALSEERKNKVIPLAEEGFPRHEIHVMTGIPKTNISSILDQWKRENKNKTAEGFFNLSQHENWLV